MLTPVQAVEAFHLAFLRVLESRLRREFFVVKGGVNLRAWFRSLRYSEDLDLDLLRGEVFEVREKVDAVLSGPGLRDLLRSLGLAVTRSSAPKQTGTTQRWKLALTQAGGSMTLHTKVEFSRRGGEDDHVLEPVLAEIVAPYGIPAPTVHHYGTSTICSARRARTRDRCRQARAGRSPRPSTAWRICRSRRSRPKWSPISPRSIRRSSAPASLGSAYRSS
jgi:hypothetical protein